MGVIFPSGTKLAEIETIEKLKVQLSDLARFEILGEAQDHNSKLPIYKISLGNPDPKAPVLGLIGGVHGLERIGAQVCIALLSSFSNLLLWDKNTQKLIEQIRLFFIPTVNPIGILKRQRSNPNGIDIMRNAPVDAEGDIPFLLGGHRISSKLPWFRGNKTEMEFETKVLIEAVQKEISESSAAVTVDFHSGFGLQDQIWFPYAKTREPLPDLSKLHAFFNLMENTYPHHFYKIETQAYLTHGDVWDYLYDWKRSLNNPQQSYLPLCLEMGSWNWVKKNPLQILNLEGPFNPMKVHRLKRILRRHNTLFEFLLRAVNSHHGWTQLSEEEKLKHESRGRELWYGKSKN